MNVWTDPTTTFSRLDDRSGIILILLDCPSRSRNPARANLARNWRLLKAFAQASGTPIIGLGAARRDFVLADAIRSAGNLTARHCIVAGKATGDWMLPIMLEAGLLGLRISIVRDAFIEPGFPRSGLASDARKLPWGAAPLYIATSEALIRMLTLQGVEAKA